MDLLCTTSVDGTTVWLASTKQAFAPYTRELRGHGERYRIVQRTVSALGHSTVVYVLTILGR